MNYISLKHMPNLSAVQRKPPTAARWKTKLCN